MLGERSTMQATGKTATVLSGASRVFTNSATHQPENWGTAEANCLSASVSYASGMQVSPTSGSTFEKVSES